MQSTTLSSSPVVCGQHHVCPHTAAAAAAPAGPVEDTVRNGKQTGGLKALPQVQPSSTATAVADSRVVASGVTASAAADVASAGCEAVVTVLASTAAAGSKCGGSSSSSVASQQQQRPRAAPPAFTTRGVVAASCHGSPGLEVVHRQLFQQAAAAAVSDRVVAAAAGVRQFKPLDQLLPRMKVIKLGC
jgi:hypothetical protein